ncbi:hypothetical protein LTR86_001706 [Recurvomyces mirabilis]|nr:hypothetical protein LTR86_001706 [Recurvomyces mirabilis]
MLWHIAILTLATHAASQAVVAPNSAAYSSRLWSKSPAVNYNNSYLIGNGRVGGAVFGNVAGEIVSVNEDSFWSGGYIYRVNEDARSQMPKLQQLIRDGSVVEATSFADLMYAGQPLSARHYELLGDLEITGSSYERYLDVDDSTAGVYYVNNGTAYFREYLSSEPAGVLAVRVASNQTGTVSLRVHLRRGPNGSLNRWEDYSRKSGNDTIVIGGHSASATGIEFAAGARVMAKGGSVYTLGDTILIDHADEAWIYFQSWTDFRKSDPKAAVLADLAGIKQTYPEIRAAHIKDYQSYAHRVELSLGNSSTVQKSQTTAQRIGSLNNGTFDPELVALYFDFGRYLFISTSRNNTLPPNLQGIWNSQLGELWKRDMPGDVS